MKDKIIIRKARAIDLTKIQELNKKLFELEFNCFDRDLNIDWTFSQIGKTYFEELINHNIVFIAEARGIVIGYVAGRINNDAGYILNKFAELENIYIEEPFQGDGVGTLLIEKFKQECKKQKAISVRVTASCEK